MRMKEMIYGSNDLMMVEAVIPITGNPQWDVSQLTSGA